MRGLPLPALVPAPVNNASRRRWEPPPTRPTARTPELDTLIPDEPTKPYDMHDVIAAVVDDGEFLEVQPALGREHRLRLRAAGRPRRSASSATSRGRWPACSTSTLDQGARASCAPATPSTCRWSPSSTCPASCPGTAPGVGRHHPPRRQAALRLLRGDGAEADRDHPQGLRRRLRRDGLEARRRRLQLRLADRRGGRDGPRRRGQHRLPQASWQQADDPVARRAELVEEYARAVRQPVHRRRARLRRRRDRAARDPAGADHARSRPAARKRVERRARKHGNIPL